MWGLFGSLFDCLFGYIAHTWFTSKANNSKTNSTMPCLQQESVAAEEDLAAILTCCFVSPPNTINYIAKERNHGKKSEWDNRYLTVERRGVPASPVQPPAGLSFRWMAALLDQKYAWDDDISARKPRCLGGRAGPENTAVCCFILFALIITEYLEQLMFIQVEPGKAGAEVSKKKNYKSKKVICL